MTKFYSRILALLFLVCAQFAVKAQVSAYTFAQSTGTYTAITGGTVLGTPTGNGTSALDDINYTLPTGSFPFTFTYNYTGYTGCTVNTNGYLTFGTTAPGVSLYTPISSTTAYAGAVSAWGADINSVFNISSQTGELRWQVVGTAPNREVVVQWTKFRPAYSSSTTNAYVFDFQIRLAEGTNAIKVVYGGNLAYLVGSTTITNTMQIGLRGATNADYNNRTNSTSVNFTASTAGATNSATQACNTNVTPPGMPTSGLTYSWIPPPPPPVDLALVSVNPPAAPCPSATATVTATIRNTGSAPIDFSVTPATITVNMTGANTQTLTGTVNSGILAVNATQTVSLTPANLTNSGTTNFAGTVAITSDGVASNNTATASITIAAATTLPISVNFTGYTGSNLSTVFPGWSEGFGATTPTGTTSTWTSTTGVGGTSNTTAKVNLYSNTHNEWIVGPRFTATSNTFLQFDAAITAFATTSTPSNMGSDDRVSVMLSTDCGATWSEIKAYTAASNGLTINLSSQTINLSSYAGQSLMIAFKGTDGTVDDAEDYDFHIDNILIGPGCTGLPTPGSVTATPGFTCYGGSVVLSSTGASSGPGIQYQWQSAPLASSTWTDIAGATALNYTINPLTSLQYRLKVTCLASGLSDVTSGLVVSVSGAPTYAAYPFTESFENWVNGCATSDRPGANWGATPSTGDNSWRRDDQGTSASWSSTGGAYSPLFTTGAHSARFHSYDANGTSGSLDLFINLSTSTATKYLKFDYINTSGSDVLKVFLSTDGGQNFTQVGTTLGVQAAWGSKEFLINSNSATAVIRLQATGDFGGSDIGVDNLQLLDACAGTPTAGTAVATPACYGSSVTVSLSGASSGVAGLTYQWQSSTDGVTWTNITGATSATYTATNVTTALRFRAIITCSIGGASSTSAPVTLSFTNVPVYAAVPYTQGFESWINACGTTDRPDASWGLTPATGDSSWRRDDQGASANWTSTAGAYSPVASVGAHSARFHSYNTPSGQTGSMDLFVNMSSTTQDKLLKFDYLNTIGTDSLVVFFSADGGTTFTRLDSLNLRAAWTTKQIIISSNSATAVIRFKAYSDFGNGAADLGIDNVQVLVGCTGAPTPGTVSITGNTPVCLGNSVTLSLSGQTTAAGITYQWQSSPDNTTWTSISGATNSTYTATPSANTYYRVVVTCTNTSQSANTPGVQVTISNPSVTSTTPGVRCGIGSVVLSATGTAGTTLRWYNTSSGGQALGTGSTFTTPSISANTTFYVDAQTTSGSANVTVGAGGSASTSYESPFYHLWGGKRSQYLVLASELRAAGVAAGNISSLGFNVISAGTSYNSFSISMKATTATAMTTTLQTGLTTVFSAASVTPTVGLNTYTFLAPFAWDGSSNIIVEVCWSNNNTGGASASVQMDPTPFVAHAYYRNDSQTPGVICGTTAATSTQSLRPQMIFNAQTGCISSRVAVQATVNPAPAITIVPTRFAICAGQSDTLSVTSSNPGYTYSWAPGGQTGSPITITPATTTKYVVTATDNSTGASNGCVNKDSVTITVNALPAAVTITPASSAICLNSIQQLTVNGGTSSSTMIMNSNTPLGLSIPDASSVGIKDSLIASLPPGSVIDSIIVTYNITHTFAADVEVNLESPNGQIINLMADEGSLSGAGFVNTRVSSDNSLPAFSSATAPFTGTFKADAAAQATLIGAPSITTQTFSDLFTNPNGYWKLRVYDDASLDVGTLVNWSLKISFTSPSSFTWTPITGLYTDAAATVPYTPGSANAATVYAKPTATTTYTVTATNGSGCTQAASTTVTVNRAPAITSQPVSRIACTGNTVVFQVGATGTALTYQWRKNGTNISGATSATLTLTNVQISDAGSYDVVISGTCTPPVTSTAATLVIGDDSWVGTSNNDWNNPLNWCGGVPTTSMNVLIPGGTPFQPVITANSSAANLVISTGASVVINNSGRLVLAGNLTNNGTFNATAGTIEFNGTSNQSVPAITAANIVMNGSGGITLGGNMNITTALTLINGNITLGSNNLVMTGGTTGSATSHIVTNGTGKVTNNNVTVASVVFPVGPTASSYNPVNIANGQGLNYTVTVATGITPAILNPARAVNRTWNITASATPASPVSVSVQYADADANGTPTANMEVGVNNGTSWQVVSPAGGVPPTGTSTGRVVGFQTISFGPTVIANVGGISTPTAIANIDADITSVVLMPSVVENSTVLRVHVRRTMKVTWSIVDGNGRTVMLFTKMIYAGQNDIPLNLGQLSGGTYQLVGTTDKGGKTPAVRLVRL